MAPVDEQNCTPKVWLRKILIKKPRKQKERFVLLQSKIVVILLYMLSLIRNILKAVTLACNYMIWRNYTHVENPITGIKQASGRLLSIEVDKIIVHKRWRLPNLVRTSVSTTKQHFIISLKFTKSNVLKIISHKVCVHRLYISWYALWQTLTVHLCTTLPFFLTT